MRFIRSSVRVAAFALIAALSGACLVSLPHCSALDLSSTQQGLDTTNAQIEKARTAIASQQAVNAAKGDAVAVAKDQADIAKLDKAKSALAQVQAGIAASTNPDGSFNPQGAIGAAGTAAMAINPALGLGIMIGGPLVASLGTWIAQQVRVNSANKNAQQTAAQAQAVVTSIETARQASPEFHAAFEKVAPVIKTVQLSVKGTEDLVNGHQNVDLPPLPPSALA